MVFKWKEGARWSVSADIAGKVLYDLSKRNELTPQNLVDVSRPEDAPLHKCFVWDDRNAAELYRKQQATQLIRHIEVVEDEAKDVKIEAFHTLRSGNGYEFINNILKDEEKTYSLLSLAKAELKTFRVKYSRLSELSKIFKAIDETLEEA